jgi:hypothetical protein
VFPIALAQAHGNGHPDGDLGDEQPACGLSRPQAFIELRAARNILRQEGLVDI